MKIREDSLRSLFCGSSHSCSKLDFHLEEGLETQVVEVKTNKYLSDLADLTEKRQCLI